MLSTDAYVKPRWLRDLLRFLPLKSQFVLSGNVKDLQTREVAPGVIAAVPLLNVLAAELEAAGFGQILAYEPITGFRAVCASGVSPGSDGVLQSFGLVPSNGFAAAAADVL